MFEAYKERKSTKRKFLADTIECNAMLELLIEGALETNTKLKSLPEFEQLLHIEKRVTATFGDLNLRKTWENVYQYNFKNKEFKLHSILPNKEEVYESAWSLEFAAKTEDCIATNFTDDSESVDRVKVKFNFTEFKGYKMVSVIFTKGSGFNYIDFENDSVGYYYFGSGVIYDASEDDYGVTVDADLEEDEAAGWQFDEDNLLNGYSGIMEAKYIILDQEQGSTKFMQEFLKKKLNSIFSDHDGEFWFSYDRVNKRYRLKGGEQLAKEPLGVLKFVLEHTITKPDSLDLDKLTTGLNEQ